MFGFNFIKQLSDKVETLELRVFNLECDKVKKHNKIVDLENELAALKSQVNSDFKVAKSNDVQIAQEVRVNSDKIKILTQKLDAKSETLSNLQSKVNDAFLDRQSRTVIEDVVNDYISNGSLRIEEIIEEYVNANNILTTGEIEELIEEGLKSVKDDIEGLECDISTMKEKRSNNLTLLLEEIDRLKEVVEEVLE